jgi:hypothetical protein
MDRGKLLAIGTVADLIDEHGGASHVEAELSRLPAEPARLPGVLEGNRLSIETDRPCPGRC